MRNVSENRPGTAYARSTVDTARLLGLHAHLLKPATSDGARPGPTLTVDDVLITPTLAQRRFRLPDATSSGNAPPTWSPRQPFELARRRSSASTQDQSRSRARR